MLSVVITVLAASCGEKQKENKEKAPKDKTTSVKVVHPTADRPTYVLELPGELKPYEEVSLFPKVKGFVKTVLVDRGSVVKKGQLLVRLDAPELTAQYQSSRSDENKLREELTYSRQAYERLRKASLKTGSVAEIELDRARSKYRSDSSALSAAFSKTGVSGQLRDYLRITAPFNGVVTSRNVSAGALVGDNIQTPLLSIAQTERLRLTVAIPEKHARSIATGSKVSFTVSDHPGKVLSATLSRMSSFLDQSSRSITAEFDVDNSSGELGGGEYAQVKLQMKRPAPSLWLPSTSVVSAQSGVFVLRANDDILERVPVKLGIRKGELQEVFGELTKTDKILIKGTEELEEGKKVKIQ